MADYESLDSENSCQRDPLYEHMLEHQKQQQAQQWQQQQLDTPRQRELLGPHPYIAPTYHEDVHEDGEGEGGVSHGLLPDVLSGIDRLDLLRDVIGHGGHDASELHGLNLGKEATLGQSVESALPALLGPLAILGGGLELAHGYDEYKHGKKLEGGAGMAEGYLGAGSGVCGLVGLGGGAAGAAAAVAGPLMAALGMGVGIGVHGDNETKKTGWLKADDGKNESATDWMAQKGVHAGHYAKEKTGSDTIGTLVGLGETLNLTAPAALISLAAATREDTPKMLPGAGAVAAGLGGFGLAQKLRRFF